MKTSEPRVFFDAVLHPHRSLSRRGFAVLMGVVAGICFGFGGFFWYIGAWPVFGFLGLDVLLVYLAFRCNYRSARVRETVRLTDRDLTVERYGLKGPPRVWRFQPNWLRVEMDDPPAHESQVRLRSHGRSLVVGAFLAPQERLDFARALRAALLRYRADA